MITVKLRCYCTEHSYTERQFEVGELKVEEVLHRVGGKAMRRYISLHEVSERKVEMLEDGASYLIVPKDREKTEQLLLDLTF